MVSVLPPPEALGYNGDASSTTCSVSSICGKWQDRHKLLPLLLHTLLHFVTLPIKSSYQLLCSLKCA